MEEEKCISRILFLTETNNETIVFEDNGDIENENENKSTNVESI